MHSQSLVDLMRMTRERWDDLTRGSAIRRAGYAGFKRNVAVAMGNWLAPQSHPPEEAVRALVDALFDDEPLVRAHAAWALGRVRSERAAAFLSERLDAEQDAMARAEMERAIAASSSLTDGRDAEAAR